MRLISGLLRASCALLIATQIGRGASAPVVRLLHPGAPSLETTSATISLEGIAIAERDVVTVVWMDQSGHRGVARRTALEGRPHAFRWTTGAIPVRSGPNQISISVVDEENQTGTVHVMVRRTGETTLSTTERAVVEGDILLNTEPKERSRHGLSPESDPAVRVHTYGFTDSCTKYLWPSVSGVFQVPYTIQGTSANLTTAINTFNSTFTGAIQLVPMTSEANYLTVVIDSGLPNGEGQSSVGMQGSQQFLYCSPTCTAATFLHEIGHTVGLLHEHQRPDSSLWVSFKNANADEPLVYGNFTAVPFNGQTIGLYDRQSVMHYGAYGFSKNGLPVLESVPAGIPLENYNGYSPGDVDQVLRLYGFAPSLVTITTNPPGLSITVDSTTHTAPQTFNWALNSTHQFSVPADPQFTSPNDGATYKFGTWNDGGAKSHSITVYGGVGTLTSPAAKPAVTVYQADFIRLWPFTLSVTPTATGTASVNPAPVSEFGGTFFTDRQLITLTAVPNSGQNFFGWFGPPYPESANPRQFQVLASMTGTQADFTTLPVTIVGASLTGPNTSFFPGMYGFIDTQFWYLPQAFAWGASTPHTINVDNPESPITTNVRYTWNSWSDGLGQSHTITQPSTGTQNISASFTPVYRTYPLPFGSCAGSASFSPVSPTGDGFYADGTVLTVTATPNSQFPAILFAGWTGDLTGSQNPQTTTIHNQFIPVANFNATNKAITITSYSPAYEVATATAQNLSIIGTGFTSGTFGYWNGGFRSTTFVSATKITMHLNAGDLATPGGQDVFVGNYDTVGINTCGNTFESQYTVKASNAAEPQLQITINTSRSR
jgi:Astacin (Peptidase family M12A)/Divergent InlB B-repeat domain